jgi:histidyl-tRNA synthetase
LLLEAVGVAAAAPAPDVYAVVPDAALLPQVMPVLETLRQAGLAVVMHAGGGSMKSQFKKADASGARLALVFGPDEISRGEVAVKPLRDSAAVQSTRPLESAAAWALELRNA